MADYVGIRAKIEAADKVGWLCLVLDPATKRTIQTLSIVGSTAEFTSHNIEEPLAEFQRWHQEMQFYTKYDAAPTGDLDRWARSTFANLEFVGQLFQDFKKGSKANLEFKLQNDLQIVLGDRSPTVTLKIERISKEKVDKAEEERTEGPKQDVDPAQYVPLSLVLSPLRGTFLSSLQKGDEVIVKCKDRTHPRAEAFLAKLSEEDADATEWTAVLKERRSNPAGGVFVFLTLPDGSEGLVVEEEPGIKVKRPGQTVAVPSLTAAGMEANAGGRTLFEDPKVLIGLAAGVVVFVAVIVLVFVF